MLPEPLGQGYDLGNMHAKGILVREHAGLLGIQSGQETDPAGIADRILAIRAVETHPLRGEAVNVGALDQVMAVRAQIVVEIVHRDEQDIGALDRLTARRKKQAEQAYEKRKGPKRHKGPHRKKTDGSAIPKARRAIAIN